MVLFYIIIIFLIGLSEFDYDSKSNEPKQLAHYDRTVVHVQSTVITLLIALVNIKRLDNVIFAVSSLSIKEGGGRTSTKNCKQLFEYCQINYMPYWKGLFFLNVKT